MNSGTLRSIATYWQLVADVDAEVARVAQLYPNHIQCSAGCSDCCRGFSVFPIEVEIIRGALSLAGGINIGLRKDTGDSCLLLRDNLCSIYAERPLICRTQGLPVGYIDHEQGVVEVSACELNFRGLEFDVEKLFMMDAYNTRLQEINADYCKLHGIDPWQRIPICEIVLGIQEMNL